MTDEYIRKQDAINIANDWLLDCFKVQKQDRSCGLIRRLEDSPPADVTPVIHSRWIQTADGEECENCGREAVYQIVDGYWEYEPWCPHCGAIMDAYGEE